MLQNEKFVVEVCKKHEKFLSEDEPKKHTTRKRPRHSSPMKTDVTPELLTPSLSENSKTTGGSEEDEEEDDDVFSDRNSASNFFKSAEDLEPKPQFIARSVLDANQKNTIEELDGEYDERTIGDDEQEAEEIERRTKQARTQNWISKYTHADSEPQLLRQVEGSAVQPMNRFPVESKNETKVTTMVRIYDSHGMGIYGPVQITLPETHCVAHLVEYVKQISNLTWKRFELFNSENRIIQLPRIDLGKLSIESMYPVNFGLPHISHDCILIVLEPTPVNILDSFRYTNHIHQNGDSNNRKHLRND